MADTILIADTDSAAQINLCSALQSQGMQARIVQSGTDAIQETKAERCNLLVLDLSLTHPDAFGVIQAVRSAGLTLPILLTGADAAEQDILYGLEIGADDYAAKPCTPVVLSARIKALLRRSRGLIPGCDNALIQAGPFRYNTSTLRFYKNGVEIPLSSKENALIKLFIDNTNRIFPKGMLYELIWPGSTVDDSVIMVYISRLRQKIEDEPSRPCFLQTVRGLGYRFVV